MVKKIRFPLEMEQGVEVRSLDELRDNFSLARILGYVLNGKLVTWLRDRYVDDIADIIECLDVNDSELPHKVCDIFDIKYDEETTIQIKKAEERNRKLAILKEHTTDKKLFDLVDYVVFTQDDLYDLLDEQQNIIYLCGEKLVIPMAKKGMTYIGINNPIVVIEAKEEVNWNEKDITLSDIRYDEKYQKVVDASYARKRELVEMDMEIIRKEKPEQHSGISGYSKNTYLNFMLSVGDKKSAESCYNSLSNEVNNINYDIDADVSKLRKQLQNIGLVGMANNYIEKL